MPILPCPSCPSVFSTAKKLADHRRDAHKGVYNFKNAAGMDDCFPKDQDGMFRCRRHGVMGSRLSFAQKHKLCFNLPIITPLTVESNNEASVATNHAGPNNQEHVVIGGSVEVEDGRAVGEGEVDTVDAALSLYDLGYDSVIHVVFCKICKRHVNGCLREHSQKKHRVSMSRNHMELLNEGLPREVFNPSSTEVFAPLRHLESVPGLQCNTCKWCCKKSSSMKFHLSKSRTCLNFAKVTVQSGDGKKYFRVFPNPPVFGQERQTGVNVTATMFWNCVDGARSTFERLRRRSLNESSEDFRTKGSLYNVLNWMSDVEVRFLASQDLKSYFACPESWNPHQEDIQGFIKYNFSCLKTWSFVQMFQLKSPNGRPFSALNTDESTGEYMETMTQLFYFVVNNCSRPLALYSTAPLDSISELVRLLSNECSYNNFIKLMYAVLTETLKMPPPGADNPAILVECIAVMFLRVKCLKIDGRLMNAEDLGRKCAQVEYAMKAVFLEWHRVTDSISAFGENVKLVDGSSPRCAMALFTLHSQASRQAQVSLEVGFITDIHDGMDVNVDGVVVNRNIAITVYHNVWDNLEAMHEELLMGCPFKVKPMDVIDDLSSLKVDYCISLRSCDHNMILIEHIMGNPRLLEKYCFVNEQAVIWKKSPLLAFLDRYDEAVELLLMFVHIGSGMPARAPELNTYTIRNGRFYSKTLCYDGESVFFMPFYSKTNSVTGLDRPVCRAMSPTCSTLILRDILILRPFAVFCATNVLTLAQADIYDRYLWVKKGAQFTDDQVRNTFADLFYKFSGGKPLNFSKYRHYIKHLAKDILNENDMTF